MRRIQILRNLSVLFLFGVLPAFVACDRKQETGSDDSPVVNPSVVVAPPLLRWNEHDADFPMPAKRAWLDSDNADIAEYLPHHQANDLFLKAGEGASVEGRFHYGDLRLDLGGEEIGFWYREAGDAAWTYWMDGVTDGDGNVSFPLPAEITGTPGRWFVKMVVYGDRTFSDSFVRVVNGTVPAVVFDIDGTLTLSDDEMISEILSDFLDVHHVPRMRNDANKFACQLAREGYEIFYVTARPYWLRRASRRWLELKGFPVGSLYTWSGAFPATGSQAVGYKSGVLLSARERGAKFQYAFGNAKTDVEAYAVARIPHSSTYTIGENAGMGGTVALEKYSDLYDTIVPAPAPGKRVLLFIVDGLRADVFRYYLDNVAGNDSALRSIFDKRIDVRNSATSFPSMTFTGHTLISTGVHPGENGIVGNKFFDRETGTPYALSGGETMELGQAISVYRGEGLANRMLTAPTIYEQMSSSGRTALVANHMYFRGAEYLYPSIMEMLSFILDVRVYDRSVTDAVLERLDGTDTPDMVTLYYGGLDGESHEKGKTAVLHPDNPQVRYLDEVLDTEMKLLRDRIESLGLLDEFVFLLCSDHGMKDLVADSKHAFKLSRGVKVIESSPYEDVYDKPIFEGDFDSHIGNNGGAFYVTLRNRETVSWQDDPRFVEDVMPVLGAIQKHRWNGEMVGAVEEVLGRESLQSPYKVYRPTVVKIQFEKIQVIDDGNPGGPASLTFSLGANGKFPLSTGPVTVESGDTIDVNQSMEIDLLGVMDLEISASGSAKSGSAVTIVPDRISMPTGTWVIVSSNGKFALELSIEEVIQPTSSAPALPGWGNACSLDVLDSAYLHGPERVAAVAHPTRTGDLVVLMNFDEGYYCAQEEAAGHGSLYPEDSIQAFFLGGNPVTQSSNVEGKSGVDIAATICDILGVELRGSDGVSRLGN